MHYHSVPGDAYSAALLQRRPGSHLRYADPPPSPSSSTPTSKAEHHGDGDGDLQARDCSLSEELI